MLLTGGCGPKINSEQITKLDKADTGSDSNIPEEEQAEPLKEDNELPEDGIITTAQMKTISGEEGEYKFHGEDKSSGITYTWIYEGEKIRNPQEQKMKVSFVTDAAKVDQVKRSANNATVGIGFALEKEIWQHRPGWRSPSMKNGMQIRSSSARWWTGFPRRWQMLQLTRVPVMTAKRSQP